jgi:cobalt-zinc-cadmium efflux system membrane fusion protein
MTRDLFSFIRRRPRVAAMLAIALVAAFAALCAAWDAARHHGDAAAHAHDHAGHDHDHGEALRPADAAHAHDEPGVVRLDDAQIMQAGIELALAAPAAIRSTLDLPGEIRLNADRTAHVVPRVAGVVEQVKADLGAQVRKGEVLAVLASTVLAEQRSELLSARKRLDLARITYERETSLWEQKVSPELDLLQARQALREAEIVVASAREKLAALGADAGGAGRDALNRYALRVPFDGTVIEKHLSVGEAVREDAQVFTVSDLGTVWAEISVPARDLDRVRAGSAVTVSSTASGLAVQGTITYVGALLGEQTRAALARVVLRNPDMAWRPGLFVTVTVEDGRTEVPVTAAHAAIQNIDGKDVVFVRTDAGFALRPVRLGRRDGERVEVLDGLAAGERMAVRNSFILKAELGKGTAEHAH